jgi:protein associated with RNAse G/E
MTHSHTIQIHYHRFDKPLVIFTEGFLRDNGKRLDTLTEIDPEISQEWSKRWWEAGLVPHGSIIHFVAKYLFYDQYFSVMELRDTKHALLGYYCDVTAPLQKQDHEYHIQDLMLDLWISPDQQFIELDWDEFEAACQTGALTSELQEKARATMHQMVREFQAGIFPACYIQA